MPVELPTDIPGLRPRDPDPGVGRAAQRGTKLYFLHALDAFPNNAQVAAFLRGYAARAELAFLREGAERYAVRVEAGEKTTGFF